MANPVKSVQRYDLFVTYVDKVGPLLKIWGQTDRQTSMLIEEMLLQMLKQFEKQTYIAPITSLYPGLVCCAQYKDGIYYRAQIRSLTTQNKNTVEVRFIDYGNIELINVNNIRLFDEQTIELNSIEPQASEFIVAGIAHVNNEWDNPSITFVQQEISYTELKTFPLCTVNNYTLVKIIFHDTDLGSYLISKGVAKCMPIQAQQMILHNAPPDVIVQQSNKMIANYLSSPFRTPQVTVHSPELFTYKPALLPPNSEHMVYVSYVEDGPYLFSIQLQSMETRLENLMHEINQLELAPLTEPPVPGYPCMARCLEDETICRAVVLTLVGDKCKTYYVDFGNTDILPFSNIYQIPYNYMLPKVMSMRFTLAGLRYINVTEEMKCAFKEFVTNKLLKLKVVKLDDSPLIQYCELYENGKNLTEILYNAPCDYKMIPMNKGVKHNVIVSFIEGCKKFFVQLKDYSDNLNKLMLTLAATCDSSPNLAPNEIITGMACCAFYSGDNQWYRAKIIALEGNMAVVRYVDYGNEETVTPNALKKIDPEYIKDLAAQAIECCLYGYQNMSFNSEIESVFESLTLECEFTMKVMNKQANNVLLVDLFDASGNNVAALLIEKLAAQKSQISLPAQQIANAIINETNSNTYNQISPKLYSPKEKTKPEKAWRNTERSFEGKNWRNDGSEEKGWKNEGGEEKKFWRSGSMEEKRSWRGSEEKAWRNSVSSPTEEKTNNEKTPWNEDTGGRGDSWDSKPPFKKRDREFSYDNTRPRSREKGDWKDDSSNSSRKSYQRNEFNRQKSPQWKEDGGRKPYQKNEFNRTGSPRMKKEWGDDRRSYQRDFKKGQRDRFNDKRSSGEETTSEKSWKDNKKGKSFSPKKDYSSPKQTPKKTLPTAPLAELSEPFKSPNIIVGSNDDVAISWFYNPENFYCQILSQQKEFIDMMVEIQAAYENDRKPISGQISVGSSVIAEFSDDSILYRATILENKHPKYKVQYVDFGNIAMVDASKIWQAEARFMELPVQCIRCGIGNIKCASETWPFNADVDKIFNKDGFVCVFQDFVDDKFIVQLWDNEICLRNQLIESGLAEQGASLEMDGDAVDLHLLTGQNVRVVLSCIVSMDKFYVQLNKAKVAQVEEVINSYGQNAKALQTMIPESIAKDVSCLIKIDDEKWCRGIVVDVPNSESISVQCLDNGKHFEVTADKLYPLPEQLCIFWYQSFACGLHNLTNDSCRLMSDEDFRKEYEEKELIMYVNYVEDRRPIVTLYNTQGIKLELFTPDEGAFPSVNKLCPYPLFTSVLPAFVVHIINLESIYLQQSTDMDMLAGLLETLYEFYEDKGKPAELVQFGLCCAKSDDGNWYRARIEEIMDDTVRVLYIDYGNGETLRKADLKALDESFFEPHEMALNVGLNLVQLSEECKDKLTELTADKELNAQIMFGEHGWVANLWDGDTDINKTLVDLELAAYPTIEHKLQICPAKPDIPETRAAVIITHIDSPSEFYVQLKANESAIAMLQIDLQDKIENLSTLEGAEIGSLCAAKYSVDEQWYRAEVLDADSDITTVRFVDFGNTDVIDNQANSLKTLPSDLLAIDKYARKCSLNVISSKGEEWSQEAQEIFENTINVDELYADIVYQDEKNKTFVELYSNDVNIAQLLIDAKLAEHITRDAEDSLANNTGFVSHLNNLSEFWIQLESSIPDLEMIVERMAAVDSFPDLQDLSPGILCAANFPEDQEWYRARILSNTVAGIEVLFVDFGNSSTALKLKVLPEELIHMPPLAQKCCLNKPPGVTEWPEECTIKFQEISEEGATVFTVKKLAPGETAIVELFIDGDNIADQLLVYSNGKTSERPPPIGEPNYIKCHINYVESPDKFWISKKSDNDDLDDIMAKVSLADEFEDINTFDPENICAAFDPNTEMWYRVKMISEEEVFLVDYGGLIPANNLKVLPEYLLKIPPMSVMCTLELPVNATEWKPTATDNFHALNNLGDNEYDVEFLNNDEPFKVRIFLDGMNMAETINRDEEICLENFVEDDDELAEVEDIPELLDTVDTITQNASTAEDVEQKTDSSENYHEQAEKTDTPKTVETQETNEIQETVDNQKTNEIQKTNDTKTEVPETNDTKSKLPDTNDTKSKVPETNDSKSEVPQTNDSKSEVPETNDAQQTIETSNATESTEESQSEPATVQSEGRKQEKEAEVVNSHTESISTGEN